MLILTTVTVVQTGVISVLPLTTFMRNFIGEGKLLTFVLYYIKEKAVASVTTVRTVINFIISCKFFIFLGC